MFYYDKHVYAIQPVVLVVTPITKHFLFSQRFFSAQMPLQLPIWVDSCAIFLVLSEGLTMNDSLLTGYGAIILNLKYIAGIQVRLHLVIYIIYLEFMCQKSRGYVHLSIHSIGNVALHHLFHLCLAVYIYFEDCHYLHSQFDLFRYIVYRN